MLQAMASKILYEARVDVVKEGVDGEVAPIRVLLWRAYFDLARNSTMLSIRLGPQIHKIHPRAKHFHGCSLQMFRLFRVRLNNTNGVRLHTILGQILVHLLRKRIATQIIQRNVDIVAVSAHDLVANPAACDSHDSAELIVRLYGQQQLEQALFHIGELDLRTWTVIHVEPKLGGEC